MTRIAAACLAGSLFAWPSSAAAEHAPPPPIVLTAAPPPELPAAEYSRRPFELTAELALGLPSCAGGSTDNQRCAGLSAGLGGGGTLLWRPTAYFAFGGTLSAQRFGLSSSPGSRLAERRASGYFVGVLGRVYVFERGLLEPYLELGLGSAGVATRASEAGEAFDESSSGIALRTGGGLEFYLSRHLRLGPAVAWTTFHGKRLNRCGSSGCFALDESNYGHGTGFTSFAIRLSVALGPGL